MLPVGNETLIVTHDAMAEGVHFRTGADMADVAWKLVAANLSDLASKGAEPIGVLLGYALGDDNDDTRFSEGLREVLAAYSVPLLGGDTIRTKSPRTFGLTAIGRATHLPVPDRRNANAGDALWVTGVLGRAMLGFEDGTGTSPHAQALLRPIPLLTEGRALAPVASAMMDVSDGLLLDCWRMANASGVSIRLQSNAIPVADAARRDHCIRWGDDYQLLFTLPGGTTPPIPATLIGQVTAYETSNLWLDETALTSDAGLGYRH